MPAVYQLVPGSIIARLWFHSIFPTPTIMGVPNNDSTESVFSNLIGKSYVCVCVQDLEIDTLILTNILLQLF